MQKCAQSVVLLCLVCLFGFLCAYHVHTAWSSRVSHLPAQTRYLASNHGRQENQEPQTGQRRLLAVGGKRLVKPSWMSASSSSHCESRRSTEFSDRTRVATRVWFRMSLRIPSWKPCVATVDRMHFAGRTGTHSHRSGTKFLPYVLPRVPPDPIRWLDAVAVLRKKSCNSVVCTVRVPSGGAHHRAWDRSLRCRLLRTHRQQQCCIFSTPFRELCRGTLFGAQRTTTDMCDGNVARSEANCKNQARTSSHKNSAGALRKRCPNVVRNAPCESRLAMSKPIRPNEHRLQNDTSRMICRTFSTA